MIEGFSWLVVWLEGEGTFHCSTQSATATRKAYHQIKVVACSNDLDTLEKAQQIAGGNINGPYKYGPRKQPHYQWGVRDKQHVVELMRTLHPYMGTRRKEQIDEALQKVGVIR